MADYGCYINLASLKAELTITDTTDDAILLRKLEAVSRLIDGECDRHFYTKTSTKYFTALSGNYVYLPDLLSVTTLKTDDDGDRTYENTWAATDYDLLDYNEFPKYKIHITPEGNYTFPSTRKGVEIVGLWGFGDGWSAVPYEDSATNTSEVLDNSETDVDVGAGTAFAVGQLILVESEQMYITAIATNTLTVKRGVNGTTAATHVTDKDIYIYLYPQPVREACLIQAIRLFRRKEAPFGIIGAPEIGQLAVITRLDPDVKALLATYRRLVAV